MRECLLAHQCCSNLSKVDGVLLRQVISELVHYGIIVFSWIPEEHLVRLQAVFDKLKAAGLKLKPWKCELFKKQINYLGHVVGHKGVATNPDKIKAVTEWPRPTTVTEVRSFLGFVSYYRRFISNFSKVAKPLNILLQNLEGTSHQKKKLKVNWGPAQQEAF